MLSISAIKQDRTLLKEALDRSFKNDGGETFHRATRNSGPSTADLNMMMHRQATGEGASVIGRKG